MRKNMEDLPAKLTEEARKQVLEKGYSDLNIRAVARSCGVTLGTLYRYYPTKDALVAGFLLEDWLICMNVIKEISVSEKDMEKAMEAIYQKIIEFLDKYNDLFEITRSRITGEVHDYHMKLRSQMAAAFKPLCEDDFTAAFLAEAFLAWAKERTEFAQLYRIIVKILQ